MPDENPFLTFTDADLSATLFRAIRDVGLLALVGLPIVWIVSGWQSACLFLVGAAISAGGIYESRHLIAVINVKLDNPKVDKGSRRSTGFVTAMFLLRLLIAAGLLYVSLKWLNGAVYSIIAGLALAVVALSAEAVLLTRN